MINRLRHKILSARKSPAYRVSFMSAEYNNKYDEIEAVIGDEKIVRTLREAKSLAKEWISKTFNNKDFYYCTIEKGETDWYYGDEFKETDYLVYTNKPYYESYDFLTTNRLLGEYDINEIIPAKKIQSSFMDRRLKMRRKF